jgi:hypothetical protein
MANKKISQLVGMGTTMDSTDLFVVAEDIGGGNYATVKCEPNKVSEYVLNPISATQISGVNKSVYLDNGSNWDTASTVVTQNPYLQVRATDGKLVTGSGIGNAVGGDNMGDCKATTDLNLQDNPIINANEIFFGGGAGTTTRIQYDTDPSYQYLTVQAQRNLILSGDNIVFLKGQSIQLNDGGENTPFEGEVRVTGGNLVIDHDNKLIVNEISGAKGALATDDASLIINGASSHPPQQFNSYNSANNYCIVHWSDSNIQYRYLSNATQDFNVDMYHAANGQTLTFYMENSTSVSLNPTFQFPDNGTFNVKWGDQYVGGNGPNIAGNTTSVYTFVRFGNDIFCSAITGYAQN